MRRRLWTVTHQEFHPQWVPFFLESVEWKDTTTSRLSATLMSLSLTLQGRHLCQWGTSRLWHRPLLLIEMEPSLWSDFATSHRRKRLRQAHGRLLLSLCQRPDYMAIKASLTRRNCVLETVKKGEMWSPNFIILPQSRIKNMWQNTSFVTNLFGHGIV